MEHRTYMWVFPQMEKMEYGMLWKFAESSTLLSTGKSKKVVCAVAQQGPLFFVKHDNSHEQSLVRNDF